MKIRILFALLFLCLIHLSIDGIAQGTITGNNTVPPGGSTTLTAATGMSSYEWLKDNVVVQGATSSTYSVTKPGTYKARVTTAQGSVVTTNSITVTSVFPSPLEDMHYVQSIAFNKAGIPEATSL